EHLAVEHIHAEERNSGGTLGSKRSVRYRVYNRMKAYCDKNRQTLFVPEKLELAVDAVFQRPLKAASRESLGKHLRGDGITDEALASMLISLWEEGLLVHEEDDEEAQPKQTHIICSMGFA
ncbi:MAG TPA: hypothetical protein PL009_12735, partial [Flavipsychrobacter sp.]|nr:hypothetical protein [Flavipsychrobacter sp.]